MGPKDRADELKEEIDEALKEEDYETAEELIQGDDLDDDE